MQNRTLPLRNLITNLEMELFIVGYLQVKLIMHKQVIQKIMSNFM